MKAQARIAVCAIEGRTRPVVLRSTPPLVLRCTADATYLVGGAAGPLGGDDLTLDIDVGPGADLILRTAAASIALPGPPGAQSRLSIDAHVSVDGSLQWLPEPSIAAAGCYHFVDVNVALDETARLVWRDELVLGRHDEHPGRWRSRLSVERNGSPVLRHEMCVGGPDWDGPAVLGGAKTMGTVVVADREATPSESRPTDEWAYLPLAAGGVMITALAANAVDLRASLEEAMASAAVSQDLALAR